MAFGGAWGSGIGGLRGRFQQPRQMQRLQQMGANRSLQQAGMQLGGSPGGMQQQLGRAFGQPAPMPQSIGTLPPPSPGGWNNPMGRSSFRNGREYAPGLPAPQRMVETASPADTAYLRERVEAIQPNVFRPPRGPGFAKPLSPAPSAPDQAGGGAGGSPTSWKMSIEPMAYGGMVPGYQNGGQVPSTRTVTRTSRERGLAHRMVMTAIRDAGGTVVGGSRDMKQLPDGQWSVTLTYTVPEGPPAIPRERPPVLSEEEELLAMERMKQHFNRRPMSPENQQALMEGYGKTHAYEPQYEHPVNVVTGEPLGRAYGGIIGLRGGGEVPMILVNGGYIPMYKKGGFFSKLWGGIKSVAPMALGAINPLLGAGVGALIKGIENKSLKSALVGGMTGYLGGKALSGGLKAAGLAGGAGETLKGGLGQLVKGKGFGALGSSALGYLSDPAKVAALYPAMAQLSQDQRQENVAAIPDASVGTTTAAPAIMPQSAAAGYVAPAQGYAAVAEGGLIPIPGYRRGGRSRRKKRGKATRRRSTRRSRQRAAPAVRQPVMLPPQYDDNGEGGDQFVPAVQQPVAQQLQQSGLVPLTPTPPPAPIAPPRYAERTDIGSIQGVGGTRLGQGPSPAPMPEIQQPVPSPPPQIYDDDEDTEGEYQIDPRLLSQIQQQIPQTAAVAPVLPMITPQTSVPEESRDWGEEPVATPQPDWQDMEEDEEGEGALAPDTRYADMAKQRTMAGQRRIAGREREATLAREGEGEFDPQDLSGELPATMAGYVPPTLPPEDWRDEEEGAESDAIYQKTIDPLQQRIDRRLAGTSQIEQEELKLPEDLGPGVVPVGQQAPIDWRDIEDPEYDPYGRDKTEAEYEAKTARGAQEAQAAKDAAAKAAADAAAKAAADAAATQKTTQPPPAPAPVDPSYRAGLMAETAAGTGGAPITGYDPFNMPTAGQPSQFDPAYGGMMSRLGGQQELGAGPAPGGGFAHGGPIDPSMIPPGLGEQMPADPTLVPAELNEEVPFGEIPPEIKEVAKMALKGEMPATEAAQLLREIEEFPGGKELILELTNEIRLERMTEGGADSLVEEGFLPPYPDNGPQGNGLVDDSLAIDKSFKDNFDERLAEGGPLPVRALLAGGEYIVNAGDAGAGRQELIDAATRVNPGTPPGAAVWDDFVGNINI